MKKLLIAQVL